MPTKASDPKCTSKKTHIGNNYVTLVYNESDEPYNIQTVKVRIKLNHDNTCFKILLYVRARARACMCVIFLLLCIFLGSI